MGDVLDIVFRLFQLLVVILLFVRFVGLYRKQEPVRDLIFWGVLLLVLALFMVATEIKDEIHDQTIVIKREVVHR
jgi:hypothetical protein